MKKEDKKQIIEQLATNLQEYENFYLTDIATLDAAATSELRRECSKQEIKLVMVKNTLLKKALESLEGNYEEFYPILKGQHRDHVLQRGERSRQAH
jgi:large subunit ribosomal protein L10